MGLECYLKLKGIQGECLDTTFRTKGVIQLLECSFNGSAPPERQKNSSISGSSSASSWESDKFPEDKPDDKISLQMESGEEEKKQEEEQPKPKDEDESPQWPFTISATKTLDSASPMLFSKYCLYTFLSRDQAGAQKVQIDSGKLWIRKFANGKPTPYIIWHFKQVQIVAFSWRSLDDGGVQETFAFRFRYCRMEYVPQNNDGTMGTKIVSEWDLQSNKAEAPEISDSAVGV